MKIAVVFLGIIILAFTLPSITGAVFDFRTDSIEETFVQATGVAEGNVTVQLDKPVWDGSKAYIAVASNDTTEVPTVYSYNETTLAAIIDNLNASSGHILTVTYDTGGLEDYSGADTGVRNVPTAIVIALIILPLGLIVLYFFGSR